MNRIRKHNSVHSYNLELKSQNYTSRKFEYDSYDQTVRRPVFELRKRKSQVDTRTRHESYDQGTTHEQKS